MRAMVLFLSLFCLNAFALEVNPEIDQFERSVEARLQDKIKVLFGAEARIVVNVHVQEEQRNIVDRGGYVPFPLDVENESGLSIKKLTIELEASEEVEQKTIEDVKVFISGALKNYSPDIFVKKIAQITQRAPASVQVAAPSVKMNEFVSVPGIWFFGAALVIGFAILMLGFFVKSAVRVQVPVFSVPNSESNSGQFPNVTDDELIKAVRALTYEEQALLMLALPVSEAVRVERLFPPGNGKLVVMDGVERIKKSGENFNNHAASMVLKKFLKDLSPLMIAFVLLSTSFAFAEETSAVKYTPKIGLRFNGGLMQNTGTSRGSASIVYGLNFFGLYYPSSDFALGAGYKFFFDQVKLNVPVNGFFLVGRMYVAGQGTRAEIDADRMVAESHGKYAFYLGTQFDRSSYYLGTDPSRTTQKLTGDFLAINALLGMELRLSHRLELNVEGSAGLVAFAASDERYKVSGYILNAGISYLW